MPLVTFSRWVYVVVLVAAFALQQPWLTTLVLALVLPGLIWGRQANLLAHLGRRIFGASLAQAVREDRRLIYFNNLLLVVMLGLAQPAFWLGQPMIGWALTGMVAAAAGLALAGYCIGCTLFYQFKLYQYKVFGRS